MLKRTFKIAWFNRNRYALTVVAIAMSVAFIVATLVLTFSLSNVSEPLAVAYADVDTHVGGQEVGDSDGPAGVANALVPPQILGMIQAAGFEAHGRTLPYAQILDSDGNPGGQSTSSSNLADAWLGASPLNGYAIKTGRAPESQSEVVIDVRTAEDASLQIGDRVTIITSGAVTDFDLVGMASFGGQDSVPYQATVLMVPDHPVLEPIFGYSDILVAGDGSADEVTTEVQAVLADELVEVVSGPQYIADVAELFDSFLGFFQIFLTVFAVIAVIVGAVIVANTFTVSVAQRTQELALFRLIGTTRRQLMNQVVIEAIALGVVGTVVGLVVGILGSGLLDRVLTSFGLGLERTDSISPIAIMAGVMIGLIVTVISSVRPAWKASSTPPIEALRSVDEEIEATGRTRMLVGVVSLGISALLLLLGVNDADVLLTGIGVGVLFLALIVLGPTLIQFTAFLARPLLNLLGPPGLLASRNLSRNASRTSAASLALMIGVALVAFFTLLGNTIGEFASDGADEYLTADYVVQGIGDFAEPVLGAELADELSSVAGVESMAKIVELQADSEELPDQGFLVAVTDTEALGRAIDFTPSLSGSVSVSGFDVLITDLLAEESELAVGDSLSLRTQFGPLPVTVSAVIDNSLPGGFRSPNVFLDEDSGFIEDSEPATYIYINAPSVDEATLDAAINVPTIDAVPRSEFLDNLTSGLSSILGLIYALLGVAIIIALVGIANTVSLAISERAGEIGAMRAAGANRKQVFFSLVAEFTLLAVIGVVVGMVFAAIAAIVFFRALSDGEISSPDFDISTGLLILSLGLGAGALASVWPARNAAMRNILDVLRAE